MKRIVHLSDLHFGRTNPHILAPLVDFVNNKQCDIVVVSGDLTQRARTAQFSEAKEFLQALKVKKFIIPGNHDIPLYKLWFRLYKPFRNFIKLISKDVEPTYVDNEIAILALSTISLWSKNGQFKNRNFESLAKRFHELPESHIKILVSHHPIPADKLNQNALCFDILMAGHEHRAGFSTHKVENHGKHLVVQAGTATSTRLRHGLGNSLNVLDIDRNFIKIIHFEWSPENGSFQNKKEGVFIRTSQGWRDA